jgi:hypothetical protein
VALATSDSFIKVASENLVPSNRGACTSKEDEEVEGNPFGSFSGKLSMRIDAEVEDGEEVELGTVHNRAHVGLF